MDIILVILLICILSHRSALYWSWLCIDCIIDPPCISSWVRFIIVIQIWIHVVSLVAIFSNQYFHGSATYWSATMLESVFYNHRYVCLGDDVYY